MAVDDEDGNSQTAKYKVTVHTGSVEDMDVEVWVGSVFRRQSKLYDP